MEFARSHAGVIEEHGASNKTGRAALSGEEERLRALEAENASLRDELDRRREVLLAYEQEMDDLSRAIAELSTQHAKLEKELKSARRATKEQKAESDAALAEARAERDDLLTSRSYRITAPLRRLSSLLGGR